MSNISAYHVYHVVRSIPQQTWNQMTDVDEALENAKSS
jgi:hypothetical protein